MTAEIRPFMLASWKRDTLSSSNGVSLIVDKHSNDTWEGGTRRALVVHYVIVIAMVSTVQKKSTSSNSSYIVERIRQTQSSFEYATALALVCT